MSKKAAEHHTKASEHHTQAAKHHSEAAKHHEADLIRPAARPCTRAPTPKSWEGARRRAWDEVIALGDASFWREPPRLPQP